MGITKTLGGDRLGSGKKQKVELHGFERSTHDRGYVWRSSMSAGTLVPFMSEVALPGDTFDINLDCNVLTHPTLGPLFGSFKTQLDVFLIPMRLYNSLMHNNALGVGLDMSKVKLPVMVFNIYKNDVDVTGDIDNAQVNPSALLSYLGIRGLGINTLSDTPVNRYFNAIPFLAYWDIYKNYYANKQETIGAYIHTDLTTIVNTVTPPIVIYDPLGNANNIPQAPSVGNNFANSNGWILEIPYTGTPPIPSQIIVNTLEHGNVSIQDLSTGLVDQGGVLNGPFNFTKWGYTTFRNWDYITVNTPTNGKPVIQTFDLTNIDEMRKAILAFSSTTTPYQITDLLLDPYQHIGDTVTLPDGKHWRYSLATQELLALKTYQSDLFNNWIQTEWIDGTSTGINTITAVSTAGGSFQIDALILAEKTYKMLMRIAVSGGSFDDWMEAQWAHTPYTRAENPMYMGGLSKELVFQQVISSNTTPGQPLGTLAGRGTMSQKHKGGKIVIKVDEPSYIMGIVSLTPRIDYSQGNKWDTYALETMADLHVPSLDEIGFQDLITEQLVWWDTTYDNLAGKWVQRSAGKQPAWINYMTNVNQVRGNFAFKNNEMFMTLNRRYEYENLTYSNIKDLTTYIDPSKFNFIFAETSLDAQNFWVQIACDITYRGKISAKVMPNL